MIGTLYIIKNTINDKVYIGKTFSTLEKRWREHKSDSKKERCASRHLYKAFNSLGIKNFYIEELGRYEEKELNNKEIQTIKDFDSYKNGYNMTLGGDGKTYFPYNDEEVIEKYKELKTISGVAEYFKCDVFTVRTRLVNSGVKLKSSTEQHQKFIYIPEIKRCIGNIKQTSEWLYTRNLCASLTAAQTRIGGVLNNHPSRKTYLGLTFLEV